MDYTEDAHVEKKTDVALFSSVASDFNFDDDAAEKEK